MVFNICGAKICKAFDLAENRKFKRYRRSFLILRFNLDCSVWKKYLCFKNITTEDDIVDYFLDLNPKLKSFYNLYQNILYAL